MPVSGLLTPEAKEAYSGSSSSQSQGPSIQQFVGVLLVEVVASVGLVDASSGVGIGIVMVERGKSSLMATPTARAELARNNFKTVDEFIWDTFKQKLATKSEAEGLEKGASGSQPSPE